MMIAETLRGNGDRAFEYYDQINPAKKNEIIDEYECEPYVYAQNILADEHPLFGLGRNSWLSGHHHGLIRHQQSISLEYNRISRVES
jgi:cellobiose phosphorylase